jgi:drug/metabolite transporter (DMT)-like permease
MPAIDQTLVVGSTNDWLVITAMGIFQVGLAYVLLARAMPHVPAVRASLILMIEPALSPFLAYAVHGEEPHASTIFGGVVIIGSVAAGSVIGRTR